MGMPVASIPPLPFAANATDVYALQSFNQDLSKSLYMYLGDIARRLNNSLQEDGTEPMAGNLSLGGHSITNVQNITGTGTATWGSGSFSGTVAANAITATTTITATTNINGVAHVQRNGVNIDAWEILYDSTFSGQTSVAITNLSAYRWLRVHLYCTSDATLTTPVFQFSANNGSTWLNTASDYNNSLVYIDEPTATVNAFLQTTGGTGITHTRTASIASSNPFGCHWEFEVSEFNQAHHKAWPGQLIDYNGTTVMHAHSNGRSGSSNTIVAMNAFRLFGANAMSGWMLIEGKRG